MSSTWLDRLAVLSGAATLAAILLLVPKLHENRLESQQMMSQLENTKTGFVVSPWHETGHWASSYILRLRDSNLRNLYIPKHYQLNSVVFVPQHFLDLIDRGQIDFSGFRTTSRLPFYAKVHHGRTPLYAKVRLQASDPSTMPLLAKPFGSQIGAYGLTHFSAITPENIEQLVLKGLQDSAFFAAHFREAAGRAILLPKGPPGKRKPLWMTRLRAQKLWDEIAAYPDFPIAVETRTFQSPLKHGAPVCRTNSICRSCATS